MKNFRRNDIFIIIAVALISVGMMIAFYANDSARGLDGDSGGSGVAVITVDGKMYREAPLSRDADFIIKNEGHSNTVRIEGNRVFMLDADCPDKSCVKQGGIPGDARIIVCLPNKVLIKLRDYDRVGASDYQLERDYIDAISE